MRKMVPNLLILLMTMIFTLAIPILALAEEAGVLPGTFFTWESIATFSGAVAAVVFIVQLLKLPLDKVWKIPTQYVVYLVSVGILLLAQEFVPALGGLTWQTGLLCLFNGFLVALAAMSAYEVAIRRPEQKNQYAIAQVAELKFEMDDDAAEQVAAKLAAKIKAETTSTGT